MPCRAGKAQDLEWTSRSRRAHNQPRVDVQCDPRETRIKDAKTALAALANESDGLQGPDWAGQGHHRKSAIGAKAGDAASGHGLSAGSRCTFRSTGTQAVNRPTTTTEKALILVALVDMASLVGQMKTAAETPKRWASALACRALIWRRPLSISLTTDCVPSSEARSDCFRSCCSLKKRST